MATKTGLSAAERLARAADLLSTAALARTERFVSAEAAEILAESKTGKALADEARSLAALLAGVDKLMPEPVDAAQDDDDEPEEDDDQDLDAIRIDFDRRVARLGLPRRCDLPAGDPREAGPGGVQPGLADGKPPGPDSS